MMLRTVFLQLEFGFEIIFRKGQFCHFAIVFDSFIEFELS